MFRAFTRKYGGLVNRLTADIALCQAYDPANPPSPLPKILNTVGLWDTGATCTILTPETVKALGLIATGSTLAQHGGGSGKPVPTHMVNVALPNGVVFTGVLAAEFPDMTGTPFGALVGMDLISQGDLAVTNFGGHTFFSFRTPSRAAVDYVDEYNRTAVPRADRNAPCPCGSGNKYKKCHGSANPPPPPPPTLTS